MARNDRASRSSTTVGERLAGMPSLAQIAWWIITRWVVQLLVIGAVIDALATQFFKLETLQFLHDGDHVEFRRAGYVHHARRVADTQL
ncbi:MAG: hypothetical protein ACKVX7_05575 [Planctomycetota bacterium]